MTVISPPTVSIVIPTWNGLHLLKQSLDAVVAAKNYYAGACEIIVVDNGSMDRTVDVLKDYYPEVRIEAFDFNSGFGYACNHGVGVAKYELVLFLNNDIYIPENLIERLSQVFSSIPDCFSVSPQTNYWRGRELTDDVFSSSIRLSNDENGELIQHWAVNNYRNLADSVESTMYGTGAALLIDRRKFLALGGFDSIFGLAYWEDVDLCLRAWQKGWSSQCTNEIIAWHKISASSPADSGDNFKSRQMTLNYLIFQLIHLRKITVLLKFIRQFVRYRTRLASVGRRDEAHFYLKKVIMTVPGILWRRVTRLVRRGRSIEDVSRLVPVHAEGWKSEPVLRSAMK